MQMTISRVLAEERVPLYQRKTLGEIRVNFRITLIDMAPILIQKAQIIMPSRLRNFCKIVRKTVFQQKLALMALFECMTRRPTPLVRIILMAQQKHSLSQRNQTTGRTSLGVHHGFHKK